MGGLQRVAGLTSVFELAGATVHELLLRVDHRASLSSFAWPRARAVVAGTLVPEALSWSAASVLGALRTIGPDLVICETARAFDRTLATGPWRVVLDYVDRLSVSYRDRSGLPGPLPKRLLFQALSGPAARFERRARSLGVEAIAAGWADARELGASWVPITYEDRTAPAGHPTHDLLFFGNLSYPPNVAAVERLAGLWPTVQALRPGTSLLLAGAQPSPTIRRFAVDLGWTLWSDFSELGAVVASARVGVVPLTRASGIQTKVLEAATLGLPQVVDPVAMAGMRPGFPVSVAEDDTTFVAETIRLLSDRDAAASLGLAAQRHMRSDYSPRAFVPWAEQLLPTPT
jgi:hypothetical protein